MVAKLQIMGKEILIENAVVTKLHADGTFDVAGEDGARLTKCPPQGVMLYDGNTCVTAEEAHARHARTPKVEQLHRQLLDTQEALASLYEVMTGGGAV